MKKEEIENKETSLAVGNINELGSTGVAPKLYTNITEAKTLFNLDNNVDNRINDCVDKTISVSKYLIKVFERDLEEENEEATKKEIKMVTILVDKEGKSYVTASKTFAFDFIKLVKMGAFISDEAIDLRIIKKNVKNSSNQALSFELV